MQMGLNFFQNIFDVFTEYLLNIHTNSIYYTYELMYNQCR